MSFKLSLAVLCVASAYSRVASRNVDSADLTGGGLDLLILHNNDMHARFEQTSRLSGVCSPAARDAGQCYGGFARVAHVVKKARNESREGTGPSVLYLNAGDTYSGTAWFTLYKWKIATEFINALHPDAVSLGNHEFDYGIGGLTPFIENLNCPVLAANLDMSKTPELAKQRNLMRYTIFNITGVSVGVIGYLTPDTKSISKRNDLEYYGEIEALKTEVSKLKMAGVNVLIALGHSGWTMDLAIAREVEDIDVVIGGHSNTFLWNGTAPDAETIQGLYPTVVRQSSGRKVVAVQAYAYTKYLGKLHLRFDGRGELIDFEGSRAILLDNSVPRDPEILRITQKYETIFTRLSNEVIGNTSLPLIGGLECRVRECNLGNLVTDAMIYKYSAIHLNKTKEPIALTVGGGIRTSIPESTDVEKITVPHLMEVLPFGNVIVSIKVNGTILRQALEHSVEKLKRGEPKGDFLQVSGITVTYDLTKEPGHRVVEALARCQSCTSDSLEAIEDKNEYQILMPNFLADGGNNYSMFQGCEMVDMAFDDLTCLSEYIRSHSPVHPGLGRITFLNRAHISGGSRVTTMTYFTSVIVFFRTLQWARS